MDPDTASTLCELAIVLCIGLCLLDEEDEEEARQRHAEDDGR